MLSTQASTYANFFGDGVYATGAVSVISFFESLINAFAEVDSVFSASIPIPRVRIAQGETGIFLIFLSCPSKNMPGMRLIPRLFSTIGMMV